MDTPTLRVSEPREILSLVPYRLGFHPAQSAVAVGLRPPRGRVGLVVRVDLPDLAHPVHGPQLARGVVAHLDDDGAEHAVLVVYTPADPREGPDPVVVAAVANFREAAALPLGDVPVWAVTGTGYLSWDCRKPRLDTLTPMTTAQPLRAGLYARQSIDVAEGIARQIERATALVDARGWVLAEVFKDNDTSASKARGAGTDWARMLTWAREHRLDVIVAINLDRLLRTQGDLLALISTGVLVTTLEGELDLASASGEMQASVLTAMARFETRRKSERQVRANVHKVASGRPLWSRTPFGYSAVVVKIDERTTRVVGWAVVPEQADAIRAAYTRVLDGDANMASLAREWNGQGFSNADGKPWSGLRVRACLLRPEVAGLAVYRGNEQAGVRPMWEAIVDEATYLAVKAVLTDPKRGKGGHPRSHPLSGVYRCGVCGGRMNAFWRKRVKGTQLTWRCHRMHVAVLDDVIRPLVEEEILPYALQDSVHKPRRATGMGDGARAALQARREALVARLDGLAEALADDRLTLRQVETATAKTREQIAEIGRQLAEPQEKTTPRFRTLGEIEAAMMERTYLSQFDVRLHLVDAPKRVTIERRA